MINYERSKADLKIYIKEICISQCKIPFIIACVSLPLAIYFLFIGWYIPDKECLSDGFILLLIFTMMILASIRIYQKLKKAILAQFEKMEDNVVQYSLSYNENTYIITRLIDNSEFKFKKEDIKKVYFQKNIIVIKLKTNRIIDFPKIKEIENMFI